MVKKHFLLIFISILVFGTLLRVVYLSNMPPALNWDEISHGYNAYSILKTGSDEWGSRFPIANFRAYGDYPLTLNLYLTIPFIWIFGLSTFAIRFPHALLGIGTIVATYFFVFGVVKRKSVGLLSALLVAIEPWFVFTSRFVLQSNVSVFLLISAMAAFVNRKQHKALLPLSIFLLGLTLFAYHTTRIFSPLLLLSMLALFRREMITKTTIVIALLFFLPLPFILLNPDARARSNEVFLINDGVISQLDNARNTSTLPAIVNKLLYNRPVYFMEQSTLHYVDYFSPQFLFFKGGTQYQFSVPDQGVLLPSSFPFFYIGFAFLLYRSIKKRDKTYQLLLLWLLLAPIPASITTERFAVLRSSTLLPLPELLSALGIFETYLFLKTRSKQLARVIVAVFLISSVVFLIEYIYTYLGSYKVNYSWTWQYGYSDAVQFMTDHYSEYSRFIVTKKYGEPHEFILFYNAWNPASYKADPNLVRYTQSNWWWVDSFDKYVFVNDWQIPKEGSVFTTERKSTTDCSKIKCALITSEGNAPQGWKKIQTIPFLDGKTAFEIYENK